MGCTDRLTVADEAQYSLKYSVCKPADVCDICLSVLALDDTVIPRFLAWVMSDPNQQ